MRPRWRIRTLMIMVAATACGFGLLVELRRMSEFERLARFHHRSAAILAEEGGSGCMDVPGVDEAMDEPTLRRAYLFHRDRGRLSARATRRPWLPAAPD